jgi:opacity protein-like surface antigen
MPSPANRIVATLLLASALFLSIQAASAADFSEGRWRLQLNGGPALGEGGRDRDGDVMISGTVDYEFPTTPHTTLSLRGMPLFLYEQDEIADNWWRDLFKHREAAHEDTVFGAGAGLAGRIYQKADVYEGLFAEVQLLALVHSGKIEGDDSNVDFLSGIGVGYQFNSNWDALLRFEHVSNAGLGDPNSGVNALRLGVGYRF